MQLWFLSVLLNVFSGLVLIFSVDSNEDELGVSTETAAPAFFHNKTFRLVLGILTALVGIIKLIVTLPGTPILGDLIPALAGIVGGGSLLVDFYVNSTTLGIEFPPLIQKICIDDKKYVGIICIVVAVLHFIFPQVLFL